MDADPRKVAHDAARARRVRALKADAETLYKAARVADRHGMPSLHNACYQAAGALNSEAATIGKPTSTARAGSEVL